jgi:LVIVD repeat
MRMRILPAVLAGVALAGVPATAAAQLPTTDDPRAALSAGLDNAGTASKGLDLIGHQNKPSTFVDPTGNIGNALFANSDLAFQGNYAFVGNFHGFNIYDIANPAAPALKTSVICPGGQGDVSVYKNLLFLSVEVGRARIDCKLDPPSDATTRFLGVRIFNISDINNPVQVGGVQTCRGSHTHTLVRPNNDPDNVYIYVSGTSTTRPAGELAGCDGGPATNPNPSQWRIEVIKVPLAAPQNAAIVNEPRLFKNEQTGALNGLQNAPQTPQHPSGINWQPVPDTNSCHDITVYEKFDLAAGSCEGNGLLIDISDPANPRRIDAVADPLLAYWHGATFFNDGKKVFFTDEWGGGTNARCRATDQLSWGANSIYEIVNRKLVFRSYYKLPVAQTTAENCVSHIPSLVPIPNRDIFVQAWYQGGASLVDFTDPTKPKEIGYFDRGPITAPTTPPSLTLGGLWSTYWYNGAVYGSEIARGLDVYDLKPTADLTQAEIDFAKNRTVKAERFNAQSQDQITWSAAPVSAPVGGNVPATLSLSVGPPAGFGAFTPGIQKTYTAETTGTVTSTAGDATLSVADPSSQNTGHLVNGTFFLPQPLQARARNAANTGTAYNNVGSSASPLNLLMYSGPISNDALQLQFSQLVNANDALRTGTYNKTLTFTLSTTTP